MSQTTGKNYYLREEEAHRVGWPWGCYFSGSTASAGSQGCFLFYLSVLYEVASQWITSLAKCLLPLWYSHTDITTSTGKSRTISFCAPLFNSREIFPRNHPAACLIYLWPKLGTNPKSFNRQGKLNHYDHLSQSRLTQVTWERRGQKHKQERITDWEVGTQVCLLQLLCERSNFIKTLKKEKLLFPAGKKVWYKRVTMLGFLKFLSIL